MKSRSAQALTLQRLKEVLHYDPETGIFTWLARKHSARRMGRRAGSIDWHGHRVVGVDGHLYRGARLAWFYVYGEWPNGEADHINRIRDDDRIANLRVATHAQNMSNKTATIKSKSGIKGAYPNGKKWMAQIAISGTARRRHLGTFETPEEAGAVYARAAQEQYGEFACFNQAPASANGSLSYTGVPPRKDVHARPRG